jgi:hypothetical protein
MFVSVPCPACKRHFNAPAKPDGQKIICPYCAKPYTGGSGAETRRPAKKQPRPSKPVEKLVPVEAVDVELVVEEIVDVERVDRPQGSAPPTTPQDDPSDKTPSSGVAPFPWALIAGLVMAALGAAFVGFCLIYVLGEE